MSLFYYIKQKFSVLKYIIILRFPRETTPISPPPWRRTIFTRSDFRSLVGNHSRLRKSLHVKVMRSQVGEKMRWKSLLVKSHYINKEGYRIGFKIPD